MSCQIISKLGEHVFWIFWILFSWCLYLSILITGSKAFSSGSEIYLKLGIMIWLILQTVSSAPKVARFYVIGPSDPIGALVGHQKAASHIFWIYLVLFNWWWKSWFLSFLCSPGVHTGTQAHISQLRIWNVYGFEQSKSFHELKNRVKMTLKPKNNCIFLKHKLWAFQWHISCQYMKKLFFCHFLMYEL